MMLSKMQFMSRVGLLMLVLLSGFVLLPFTPLSADPLDWRAFAGIYQPTLTVHVTNGAPGSAFLFHGDGYPAGQVATVFVDGMAVAQLVTDGQGEARFVVQTHGRDALGSYQISLATDVNASATAVITLDNSPVVAPPVDFIGLTLPLNYRDLFLPVARRNG